MAETSTDRTAGLIHEPNVEYMQMCSLEQCVNFETQGAYRGYAVQAPTHTLITGVRVWQSAVPTAESQSIRVYRLSSRPAHYGDTKDDFAAPKVF